MTLVETLEPIEPWEHQLQPIESRRRSLMFDGKRIAIGVLTLYALSGIYVIPADYQAVVTRFGRITQPRVLPGIHYAVPWPVDRVYKLKVLETRRAAVGGEIADETLGRMQPFQMQFLTGDENIIHMRIIAQYHVAAPADFLFHAENVEALVRAAVESELAREAAWRGVDALLTTDKAQVQQTVRSAAQGWLDDYGVGVSLSSVNIESSGPPPETAEAFRDVAGARADAARIVNEAQGYARDLIPRARGDATQMYQSAEAYRTRKINEAQGDANRFRKLSEEYHKAREVTSRRLYIETMEQILPRIKKLILDRDVDLSIVRRPES